MSEPADPVILNIDTLIERPQIEIDGRRFELLAVGELSLRQSHQFGIWARRMQELQDSEDPAIDDSLTGIVDQIVQLVVVDLEPEVFGRLKDEHKLAIAQVFTGLLLRSRMSVAEATAGAMARHPGTVRTGERPSPGFSGFTAARRWIGSIAHLWR